jgi:hypothetical protein
VACVKAEFRYLAADEYNHGNRVPIDSELEGLRTWYLPHTSQQRYI